MSLALSAIGSLFLLFINKLLSAVYFLGNANNLFFPVWVAASYIGLIIITYFLVSVGFAAFTANVIQFGIDQLQDLPARNCFLFIYWFLLTSYIGVSIGKLAFSAILSTFLASLGCDVCSLDFVLNCNANITLCC